MHVGLSVTVEGSSSESNILAGLSGLRYHSWNGTGSTGQNDHRHKKRRRGEEYKE